MLPFTLPHFISLTCFHEVETIIGVVDLVVPHRSILLRTARSFILCSPIPMLARIYDEMIDSVAHLDHDTQARVIYAYVRYQIYGELPDPSDVIVYSMVKAKQVDLDGTIRDVKASVTNGAGGGRPVKTWENSQKPKGILKEPKGNLEVSGDKRLETRDKRQENIEDKKNRYMDFVFLTESEHSRLIEKFGSIKTNYWIDRLNSYIGQIGVGSASKKYKSHYFTILNWERREGGKSSSDYVKDQAITRQREKIREQIDEYLHSNDSTDVGIEENSKAVDRRREVFGS